MEATHFVVTAEDLEKAKILGDFAQDVAQQHQVMTNSLAAIIAKNILCDDFDVDIESSIGIIPQIASEYGFADVYVNGLCIDVRLKIDDEDICIPQKICKKDVTPYAYMFIKLSENLLDGEFLGFVLQQDIQNIVSEDENIIVSADVLRDINELMNSLSVSDDILIPDNFDLQVFNFLDGRLSDTAEFYATLLKSKEARGQLLKAYKAEMILGQLAGEYDEEQGAFDNNYTNLANDEVVEDTGAPVENSIEASFTEEYSTEVVPSLEELENSDRIAQASGSLDINVTTGAGVGGNEQINTLFTEDVSIPVSQESSDNCIYETNTSKRKSKFLPVLLSIIMVVGVGYYGYNKYVVGNSKNEESINTPIEQPQFASDENKENQDAMPVETIENTTTANDTEVSTALSIPAIEQNLNASVYAANLSIDWNVPQEYITNSAAKRYLTKIGKIIQLNLKTELMLIGKVPLSNKVMVELQFKKDTQKFEIKGITYSSGEKTIDDVIKGTVTKVLDMSQSQHMATFEKIQGNPVIVIKF